MVSAFMVIRWLALMTSMLSALPGLAAQNPGDPEIDGPVPTMLVLDLSGSMNEGSPSKLNQAKQALGDLLPLLPPQVPLGLRVYGDGFDPQPAADRRTACLTDSRVLVPLAPSSADGFPAVVDGLQARGDTPVALGLAAAADDLATALGDDESAPGRIILISDGRDECYDADLDGEPSVGPSYGPDPCRLAGDLHDRRPGIRIDTVGFLTGDSAERELRCIAERGGGVFVPVSDSGALAGGVAELINGEIQRSEPSDVATPVTGSPQIIGAPQLGTAESAAGVYTDRLAVGDTAVYRAVLDPTLPFYITATVFDAPEPPRDTTGQVADTAPALELFVVSDAGQQVLLSDRVEGIGQNRSGSDSARIAAGWLLLQDGADEVLVGVRLTGADAGASEALPVELALEGLGFGGVRPGCPPEARCQYLDRLRVLEQQAAVRGLDPVTGDSDGRDNDALVVLRARLDEQMQAYQEAVSTTGPPSESWPRWWLVVWGAVVVVSLVGANLAARRVRVSAARSPVLASRDGEPATVAGSWRRDLFWQQLLARRPHFPLAVRVAVVILAVVLISVTLVQVSSASAQTVVDEEDEVATVTGGADFRSAPYRGPGPHREQVTEDRAAMFALRVANDEQELRVNVRPLLPANDQPADVDIETELFGPDLERVARSDSELAAVPYFGSPSDERAYVWYLSVLVSVDDTELEGKAIPVELTIDGVRDPGAEPCTPDPACDLDEQVAELQRVLDGTGSDAEVETASMRLDRVRLEQRSLERQLTAELAAVEEELASVNRGGSPVSWPVVVALVLGLIGAAIGWLWPEGWWRVGRRRGSSVLEVGESSGSS